MDIKVHSEAPAFRGLQWSGRTDRGKVRPNNEDAFLGLQFDDREVHHLGASGEALAGQHHFAFAVSDGMGGARAGEHASRIAVQKITALLPRFHLRSSSVSETEAAEVMGELFIQIHEALSHLGRSYHECSGMEATLSLCWFTPWRMFFGHVGDSRIYHLPAAAQAIRQLSDDDTHVGWLLRNGRINEREARTHPQRNVLQKALGAGNQFVTPQIGAVTYESGDLFLLCSDGLVEGLYDSHLAEFLRSPGSGRFGANLAHLLVEESLERNGRDNTTALVIRVI